MAKKKKSKDKPKQELEKKNTSLRLDKSTLKSLKLIAIEEDTSVQNIIESLVLEYLKQKSI